MGECLIVRRGGESYELPVLSASYPRDVTVTAAAGASASFSISITTPGRPAEYTYQWYRNGAAVSGGTAASLTLTGLTTATTYSVYCKVTNKAGSVNSRTATLTVRSYLPTYTYTGSQQLIDEGNFNWRLRLLTSGTLTFSYVGSAGTQGAQAFEELGVRLGEIGSARAGGLRQLGRTPLAHLRRLLDAQREIGLGGLAVAGAEAHERELPLGDGEVAVGGQKFHHFHEQGTPGLGGAVDWQVHQAPLTQVLGVSAAQHVHHRGLAEAPAQGLHAAHDGAGLGRHVHRFEFPVAVRAATL